MDQKLEVQYPQNFDIKLIISADNPIEDSKRAISAVFNKCKVVHSFVNVRASQKGNYLSFCYNIDIESKTQLDETYKQLRSVPGLKFAL